ncbi:DNA topoisomerase-3 [Dysgonomonas sp. PFB1-18]|uniref:type IA DNA topoisomerase n=1 Tax=unclassified Dysgonomonas TaxID=2630389 RepID=UPI0024742640|nr:MULTISPECIES: type IA DNA topoisomerase [unclassified Dysgonomonas]MDH6310925.1 DNA topoisomerase-3 [Dysgonomonas sp. PF1-14]MDH6340860.1 DNA topoisomerase-3 [Dysgonomonas sp. PF1-16]MDH6382448.1 DNA topoisomerase-3 [Dysgonomonas sp. PFB1-18]MDH6399797.1 DNA topoisomerase-3 [Dysgonomonas sp. PF1-23]
MIAIVAEKPSVAQDIARVLGATHKKDGYIEGNGYLVTWAYGHLVSLAYPEDYGIDSYSLKSLPILPEPFKLIPRKKRTKKGYQTDGTASKQLIVIRRVFDKCEKIIAATDAGREGELIFRHIYNYLECKKPFSRLWISSLTDKAIREGFENLADGTSYDNLYLAAEARSKADWLIGINASRALCLSSGDGNNSLGRVQTPTLALICKRYQENVNFQPQPYWQMLIKLRKDDAIFPVKGITDYFDKAEAEDLYKHLKTYSVAKLSKLEQKQTAEEPPLLYDLTNLQKDANTKYGFSAEKTLSVAQKLYEGKFITYPRTSSRYISSDVFEVVPDLIANLKSYSAFSHYASLLAVMKLNQRSVDGKKITDHHALLITENIPHKIGKEERIIYELIAGRFLEAFSGACLKHITEAEFSCDNMLFKTKGWVVKDKGWRNVYNAPDEDVNNNQPLPELTEGEYLHIESHNLLQKSTKAKPLYTDAGLLSAMENAGKEVENKESRQAMKDCGIGTPATRAGIIETLLNREYIVRNKKSLIPTKKGMALYNSIKTMRIADVEMTGLWENALAKIEKTPDYYTTFLNGMVVHTKQVTDEIVSVIKAENTHIETPYVCPKCRLGKITIHQKIAKCNYSKCRYTFYRDICGKTLTDNQLSELFNKSKSPLIKGFKGKNGNAFDAYIEFTEGGRPVFRFPQKKEEKDNNTESTAN